MRRAEGVEVALVLILPIVAVWAFGISLIDQHAYVDPEFYTGYGQSFVRMWHVFGTPYYATRFPVLFLNVESQQLLPGIAGYALVRAIIFATGALPLYLLARRLYGSAVALTGYVFLLANPLLARILCWDLTIFVSIPCALGGAALWYLSERRWSLTVCGAGFLFAASVASHSFTGTAILVFLIVESIFALFRPRGIRWLIARALMLATGALVCLALGMVFYRAQVGPVSPQALWDANWAAVKTGRTYAETHYVPILDYFATNFELYVPLFTTALLVALDRTSLLKDSVPARITWFSVAYVGAYIVAIFVLHMNIAQYFWYFGHLTVVVYLGIPVIVGRMAQMCGRAVAAVVSGALIVVAAAVSIAFEAADHMSYLAQGQGWAVLAFALAATCTIVGLATRRRRIILACAAATGVLLQVPFLSRTHLSIYDRRSNAVELPLFDAIRSYHALLNQYDAVGHRVRTWYPTRDVSLLSVGSSNLLFTLQDPWTGEGMPSIGDHERQQLADPETKYVLLVAKSPAVVEDGVRNLISAGVRVARNEDAEWGYAPLKFYARLVSIER